ncbi:uncharacterized protein J7T54_003771 [Emericellopsis cladophorae]|uniref:Myb-like domain-containing protein n=1 Tax=Emericellopsis cladophorae TaxID=2686198 RepID=A0A9P9XXU6_9HYPO|nr:uncharacterized protein J7T54_003771 [Emericellopsis cladophorae]KAI6779847.1 hypothetical protein J7T54_003771 [Emericellopsis cladophorae]
MSANGKDNKKWDDSAEKDLAMAIILSQNDGKIKADWNKAHESMSDWGYSFTKDAMNQHWSKRVLKSFKERHSMPTDAKKFTPVKNTAPATPQKSTGKGSAKKTKKVRAEEEAMGDETPSKKRKRQAKVEEPKTEDSGDTDEAEELASGTDGAKFKEWLNGFTA